MAVLRGLVEGLRRLHLVAGIADDARRGAPLIVPVSHMGQMQSRDSRERASTIDRVERLTSGGAARWL